jgi:hypothetical protein
MRQFLARREGGGGAEITPPSSPRITQIDVDDKSNSNFDVAFGTSGNNVVIYVQGDDGANVDWAGKILIVSVA